MLHFDIVVGFVGFFISFENSIKFNEIDEDNKPNKCIESKEKLESENVQLKCVVWLLSFRRYSSRIIAILQWKLFEKRKQLVRWSFDYWVVGE